MKNFKELHTKIEIYAGVNLHVAVDEAAILALQRGTPIHHHICVKSSSQVLTRTLVYKGK